MRVGVMIEGQEGLTWDRWWRLAQAAEDLGYESLCRSDHLTGLGGESRRPSLETWVSLTALATSTPFARSLRSPSVPSQRQSLRAARAGRSPPPWLVR